jgi:hypothetical protein
MTTSDIYKPKGYPFIVTFKGTPLYNILLHDYLYCVGKGYSSKPFYYIRILTTNKRNISKCRAVLDKYSKQLVELYANTDRTKYLVLADTIRDTVFAGKVANSRVYFELSTF